MALECPRGGRAGLGGTQYNHDQTPPKGRKSKCTESESKPTLSSQDITEVNQ